jgi:uncharacterized damage-inducible protein DinB
MKYLSKDIYLHMALYNKRANAEMFGVLAKLTDKARRRDTGSWFGSIHRLVNHILIADMHWLNRFKPVLIESNVLNDPLLSPARLSWQHDLCEDFDDLQHQRKFVDDRIIAWFEECPEDRYGNSFQYLDSAENLRSVVVGQAFEFLFVHQIHHRGQVSQVLDTLGLPNNVADNVTFLEG